MIVSSNKTVRPMQVHDYSNAMLILIGTKEQNI